ncbi:RHS repeat-associated core domain-containing protein [Myxococcus fulvus]|uniref:RHS repeat-associated core domain-containing protein n=1 Tax=Myxococcus fulvus TaxID=33 RepID=UPI003B994D6C
MLVNGVPARVVAGAFSAYVQLVPNTPTPVLVTAADIVGNRSQKSVDLTLRGGAPRVTLLEPAQGSESEDAVVTVRARVESAAPLREVRIGTSTVTSTTDVYTAEVPLSHGENVIHVTAEDTQIPEGEASGMVGSASVTVRYLEASKAPLVVTGVSPRAGEQGVEPDALISVSFNKPILGTGLSERFLVRVQGQSTPLPGGYSVVPGSQTVSFIARDPLPEGARLTVEVKQGLAPETPPGMGGDFSSDFTVRRPLTRVRGYVVDADYRPLPGVKVAMEGTSLSTVTGPDGNWTLFSPRGGEVVMRYEGGLTSEGASYPSLRRRLFVNHEADTLDAPLVLTAVDMASAQVVDALHPMTLRFADRQPDLRIDVPEDGLFFEDGMTRGLVTATELQPYALPLPMDGRAALGALWQIGPAGVRLQKTVSVTFPNRAQLPAGRLALVLGHDPQRHVLKRVGFAQVSPNGKTLEPLAPLGLTSLEFIGYVPLNDDQHVAVANALGLSLPDAGTEEGEGFQGSMPRSAPSEPLWKKFMTNFMVTQAHAQLGGLDMAGYNAFDTMLGMAVPGAVLGSVRAPLERQLELEVRAPALPAAGQPASEQTVALPYTLALDFRSQFVSADPYDVENPETVLVKLVAQGPSGNLPEPTPGAWQSEGEGEAALAPRVALPVGKTTLTLSAQSKSTHRLMKLEAELVLEPADGGPASAKLRLRTLEDTFTESGDEAVHSPVRFKNLRVTLTGPGSGSAGTTGASGGYGIPVPGLMGGEMGISCTEIPTGPRMVERLGEDGVMHYTPTLNQFPVCSQTYWLYPGRTTRADILVDVRMLHGALTFVDRHGEPLALNCDPEAHSQKAPVQGEYTDIALKDVKSTEVHFFRADDLEHPIATFAAGTPNGVACTQGPSEDSPHGYYARVRTGPAARIRQMARERCRELDRQLGGADAGGLSAEDQGYYDGNCRDNRTNTLRLNPGDRLVVFAVNHATGYSGMTSVIVPSINRVSRTETGGCQADDEAGGPLQVTELGEPMTLSRCTQSELGIPADLKLFPPEIDVRVARRMTPEGVQVAMRPTLIRHGGAATTRDDFLQMATHWRVRQLPEPHTDGGVVDAGASGGGDGGPSGSECTDAGFLPDGGICEPDILRDRGAPGQELEQFCSELPPSSPQRLQGRCDTGTPRVVDVPPGVPPLAGRLVQVTQTAVEQPVVVAFPVRPGRHTASVQASLTYQNESGAMVSLSSLTRANYYLHVVGHPMYERDRNDDGFLQPDEVNAPPPNFCEPGECQNRDGEVEPDEESETNPDKLPKWAVGLKNIYRHRESDGSALERYDRAREHEFRVLELGKVTVSARPGDAADADGGSPDAGRVLTGVPRPSATEDDLAYQFLIEGLQEPDLPGRAGTVSGEYRLRLGTDDFGIECPVVIEEGRIRGTCDGEFLPEVLSAADILYFELYLSGNADNVLYRFNFHGISPRTDFVTAGSEDTLERSMARATSSSLTSLSSPAVSRPISVKAMAHFAIEPDTMTNGIVRLCEGPDCNASTLLKAAELKYIRNADTGVGTYEVVRYLDEGNARVKQPLILLTKPGANGARRFALPLSNDLGRMHDMLSSGRELFLVLEPEPGIFGASAPVKMALGEPVGRYTFVNARAAGQSVVENVNLAGGHLSVTHEDFSVPHLAETVSFSRTFNNQSNEMTPLGVGWSHAYEGFVVEEELGRYIVVLAGQSYDFPRCETVAREDQSASDCRTDKSHGGRLTVTRAGAEFVTPRGMVYRFLRPSVLDTGIAEQRRWVLSEYSDGLGQDSPKQGWTALTYAQDSDRVLRVTRTPGHVSLAFEYEEVDEDEASEKLKLLARTQGLKLLSAVGVYRNEFLPEDLEDSPDENVAIHRVEFEHDARGNLKRAVRRTGLPQQAWVYEYAPLPEGVSGYSKWRLVNELRTARYQVTDVSVPPLGEPAFYDQWVASYGSSGSSRTYEHVQSAEVIDSATSSGKGPTPYQYLYEAGGHRKVTRPDGVQVAYVLTSYGSATSVTVGSFNEHKTVWRTDGQVSPAEVTLPSQVKLGYDIDSSHRLLSLSVTAPGGTEYQGPIDPGTQTELVRQTFTNPVNQQFSIPDQRISPSTVGTQSVNTRVMPHGKVEGVTVYNSDGTTARKTGSREYKQDGSGVLLKETDAQDQVTTYSDPSALGLPQSIVVENPNANDGLGLARLTRTLTYDALGRVASLTETETGARQEWAYDSLGRVTRHFVLGTPSQEWTYSYTPADRRVTMREHLNGSVALRTVETWEVTEGDESVRGVFEEERTPYGPPGHAAIAVRKRQVRNGRLVSTTDATGVERAYDYDTSGRMTAVRIVNAGTTAGPSGVTEMSFEEFDSNGRARKVVDHNGLVTRIGHDFLGRPVTWDYTGADAASGERSTEEWRRNFQGDVVSRAFGNSASRHVLDFAPDALGQVRSTKTNLAGSASTSIDSSTVYDDLGRVTRKQDHVMETDERFEYRDVLGRLTRYRRTIATGAAPLLLEETRRYEDGERPRKVTITRSIGLPGSSPPRLEVEEERYDLAGRLVETSHTISGQVARWSYTYNARGQMLTEVVPTDASGSETTTYHYDSAGNLYRKDEPGDASNPAAVTEFFVDGEGRAVRQKGPHPDVDWRSTYDAFGQLKRKELVAAGENTVGATWTYAYALSGKPGADGTVPDSATEETDPLGYKTYRYFNARYQLLKEVREDKREVAGGGTSTNGNTRTSTYSYVGPWLHKQVTTDQTAGGTGSPSVLTFEHKKFDDRGRSLETREHWQRGSDSYEYVTKSPWMGRTVTVVQTGTVTTSPSVTLPSRQFDVETNGLGQLESRTQGGLTDSWAYDAMGVMAREQSAGQPEKRYTYEQGLLTDITLASGSEMETTHMAYRLDGRVKSVTDPSERVRAFFYGPRGLLVREWFGKGTESTETNRSYDAGGFLAKMWKDPSKPGEAWEYKNGPMGEVRRVTPPGLAAFNYEYDAARRLTAIQRPAGGVPSESFEYDYLGRNTKRKRGPSEWVTSWVNGVEQVTSPSNAETVGGSDWDVIETLVDGRGRPVWKTFQAGASSSGQQDISRVSFAYDALDSVVQAHETRGSGNVLNEFSYDARGRIGWLERSKDHLTDKVDRVDFTYVTGSDLLHRRTSGRGADGARLEQEFGYDGLARINAVRRRTDGALVTERTVAWEPGGGRLARIADGGLVERNCYDGRGWLTSVRTTSVAMDVDCSQTPSSPRLAFEYTYDARGNRIREDARRPDAQGDLVNEPTEYGYDPADRLTGVRYPGGAAELYKLAADGTRLGARYATSHSGTLSTEGYDLASAAQRRLVYGFDDAGGLKTVDDLAQSGAAQRQATYFTDGSGRVRREKRSDTDLTHYDWNAEGRLAQVRVQTPGEGGAPPVTTATEYRYGYDGLRRAKTTSTGTTRYVWAGEQLVEEQLAGDVRLDQEVVAGLTLSAGGERILHDGLGSAVARVNGAGALTQSRFEAWGSYRSGHVPSESQSSAGFTGHSWDGAAGLTYAQQRWYDGKTGRFLSEDPVGAAAYLGEPTGMQPWGYANANPTRFTDPDGRSSCYSGESHTACEARLALSGRWGSSPFFQGEMSAFRGPYELMEEERQRELQKSVRGALVAVGVGASIAAPPVFLALAEAGTLSAPAAASGLWLVETGANTAVDYGLSGHVSVEGVIANALMSGFGAMGAVSEFRSSMSAADSLMDVSVHLDDGYAAGNLVHVSHGRRTGAASGRRAESYLSELPYTKGYTNSRESILEAFRKAKHTTTSKEVLELLDAGKVTVVFDPHLKMNGIANVDGFSVNSSMSLEDVLAVLVHEGRHYIDIQKKIIPAYNALPKERLFAELRAHMAASDFVHLNQFVDSTPFKHPRHWGSLAGSIVDSPAYKSLNDLPVPEMQWAVDKASAKWKF